MDEVFVGSAALARGGLTRGRLRWNYRAIFPDVYMPKLIVPSLAQNTIGAWLWSGSQWRDHGSRRRGNAWRTLGQGGYADRNDLAMWPTAARHRRPQ